MSVTSAACFKSSVAWSPVLIVHLTPKVWEVLTRCIISFFNSPESVVKASIGGKYLISQTDWKRNSSAQNAENLRADISPDIMNSMRLSVLQEY